jgi:DNA topoisomerase-2
MDDYKTLYQIQLIYDDNAREYLNLAFNPKMVSSRKDLIERYTPDQTLERYQRQSISHFVNFKVIEFSVADVMRSIPGFDGLKDSQRRILNGIFMKWGSKIGKGKLEPMVVARFGAYVASKTDYHHGESSLSDAIIHMAQNFVGSNNLNHLFPKGNFGSRNKNGADKAAPRYPKTMPMWWLRLIYRKDDDGILPLKVEEGKEWGYERFKPIIPMPLVNGCLGIATGFSTFIPPHNPLDLVIWVLLYMYGLIVPKLTPWYRGFTGEVKVAPSRISKPPVDKNAKFIPIVLNLNGESSATEESEDLLDLEGDEEINQMGSDDVDFELGTNRCAVKTECRKSVYTSGVYQEYLDRVVITELPIGRSIHGYDVWLRKLLEEKKITDYSSHSLPNQPHFTVYGFSNPNHRNLRLERSFGLSNMVLLDDEGRPRYYKDTGDLLTTFYRQRLAAYQVRKDLIISNKKKEIIKLTNKLRFIEAVVYNKLIVNNRPEEDVYVDMDQLQLNRGLLGEVTLHQCTTKQIETLRRKIGGAEAEIAALAALPPTKMWEAELIEFVEAYLKNYPEEINRMTDQQLLQTGLAKFYSPDLNPPNPPINNGVRLILNWAS